MSRGILNLLIRIWWFDLSSMNDCIIFSKCSVFKFEIIYSSVFSFAQEIHYWIQHTLNDTKYQSQIQNSNWSPCFRSKLWKYEEWNLYIKILFHKNLISWNSKIMIVPKDSTCHRWENRPTSTTTYEK